MMVKKCLRCNYEWTPRIFRPRFCPRCNSPYWNKMKKKVSKQEINNFNNLIKRCHLKAIDNTSEKNQGVRDDGGIDNCSYRILSYELANPKDIPGLAVIIIIEIAQKGHFFVDGNKRTAFAVCKSYLLEKGYVLDIPEIRAADDYIREITSYESRIPLKKAKKWIKKYIKKNSISLEEYIINLIVDDDKGIKKNAKKN